MPCRHRSDFQGHYLCWGVGHKNGCFFFTLVVSSHHDDFNLTLISVTPGSFLLYTFSINKKKKIKKHKTIRM